MSKEQLSALEQVKIDSDALRGTIKEGLDNGLTGAIAESDQALIKFHGMYQQDDRDRREERAAKKLERLYSFMIRLRLPGGTLTPEQWIALHHVTGKYTTEVIKITSRQTIQLHGLLKSNIKPTIKAFDEASLTSIATCGDINRNVLCNSYFEQSSLHEAVFTYADKINKLLLPKTRGYYEIWLDEEKIADKKEEEDILYEDRYLPRKFKIAIAIPPNNDVDVFTNDLGLIAIIEDGKLLGFNIAVGGGLGTTHGDSDTYPRLGTVIGFVDTEEKILKAVYEIVIIQRDYGNRQDRKQARLKYTLDKYGVEWFVKELENRVGFRLEASKPFSFTERKDHFGWQQNDKGLWYYTVFVENGRVTDLEHVKLKSGLLEVAQSSKAQFRFTCTQNVILSEVLPKDKEAIQGILDKYNIDTHTQGASLLRKNAMACVAFNTCPLALAEAQRYLPTLITKVDALLEKYALSNEEIVIRMTGCPNGCARPYTAEIGFVGTAYGKYNLYVGGDNEGLRLNKVYKESLDEAAILRELDLLLDTFKKERTGGERFGDFANRKWNN